MLQLVLQAHMMHDVCHPGRDAECILHLDLLECEYLHRCQCWVMQPTAFGAVHTHTVLMHTICLVGAHAAPLAPAAYAICKGSPGCMLGGRS